MKKYSKTRRFGDEDRRNNRNMQQGCWYIL